MSYRRSVGLGSHVLAGLKVRHRSADFAWCQQDIRAIPIEAREIRGGVMDTLFGEGQSGLKVVLFVIVVLGLLALAFWLLRRIGGGRPGGDATRRRQLRLAGLHHGTG